jgi:hypothetical protein
MSIRVCTPSARSTFWAFCGRAAHPEPALQHGLELLDDLGRDLLEAGDADRHVALHLLLEAAEHDRRLVGRQMCEDERHRLRVLAGEEVEDLAGVGAPEELEGRLGHHLAQPGEDLAGALGAERRFEEVAGAIHAATREVVVRLGHHGELDERRLGVLTLDRLRLHDLRRDPRDVALAEQPHDLRGAIAAELQQHDGGFLRTAQVVERRELHRAGLECEGLHGRGHRVTCSSHGWMGLGSTCIALAPVTSGPRRRASCGGSGRCPRACDRRARSARRARSSTLRGPG